MHRRSPLRGRSVISNTDTSQGLGKHWVTFHLCKRGPYEFFVSLGHMLEEYAVGFEKILNKKYLWEQILSFKRSSYFEKGHN